MMPRPCYHVRDDRRGDCGAATERKSGGRYARVIPQGRSGLAPCSLWPRRCSMAKVLIHFGVECRFEYLLDETLR